MSTVSRDVFSVSDVAERIKRPNEELRQAITRVRNWTKEGLLSPSGEANPGTGRAREYSTGAMVDALLIETFVQCFGSAAVSVPKYLKKVRHFILDAADVRQIDHLLLIGRTAGREDFHVASHSPSKLGAAIKSGGWETYMVLDISVLRKKLFGPIAITVRGN
ncbi:hypothetical protein [Bradyrhizobium sp. AUGA SZCCT0182]|uniref:hypothetical protein n=1 Tax=Bradyrhizobium sp. AUGA SZCCT0182 TaxID=2807667 RepID=UPI001BAA76F5|nr:hypothetical protein [Bradyrhizobium sp. AUGA SZCCT0182]MBR1238187.1 hypothetical protein [Bradyrhizobium sp. AUGA SZCCT0182]